MREKWEPPLGLSALVAELWLASALNVLCWYGRR